MANTTTMMPLPKQQFLSSIGSPLVGGKVYTYAAGTNNPKATYTDAAGTVPQPNPIPLNARGEPDSPIYWSGAYKVEVRDTIGNVIYTVDNYNTDPMGVKQFITNLASSAGSSLLGFIQAGAGAVFRWVQDKLRDQVSIRDFGAVADGAADDAAAINKALSSGSKVIDGLGLTCKINSSVTVPPGVSFRNISLLAGTNGMNMVLYNSDSRLQNVRCRGTGTVSIVERGFYPASDGVTGAHLDVEVENITVGLQLCPLAGGVAPHHNYLRVTARDIVGTTGASEGYAVLCSPATDNEIHIQATNIKRHALYLSAGASRNQCFVQVDTGYHHAVSVYSVAGQPVCADNIIFLNARNLSNPAGQVGLSVALGLTQGVERTRAWVTCFSSGQTDHAVRLDGVGSGVGPWPTNNVIMATARGTFLGNAILYSADADNTIFSEPIIEGKAVTALVQFTDTTASTYTPKRAGAIRGGSLDGTDSTNIGIAVTAGHGVVDVSGQIGFYNVSERVHDYTAKRVGINKQYRTTYQFTNVPANGSLNTTINLPETFTNMAPHAQITSASAASDALEAVILGSSPNSVTVAAYNRSGGVQAVMDVTVWVTGD